MLSTTLNPTTSEITGIFPVIAWILLTWMDMSKRLNLPCAWAIPSPSLSLASRHIHFSPHLLRFIFLLDGFFCFLLSGSSGGCCLVQRLHKTFKEQLRRLYKARGVRPMITVLASTQKSTRAAQVPVSSNVSSMLKHQNYFEEEEERHLLFLCKVTAATIKEGTAKPRPPGRCSKERPCSCCWKPLFELLVFLFPSPVPRSCALAFPTPMLTMQDK